MSAVAKVLEIIVKDVLIQQLVNSKIISNMQHGILRGESAENNLLGTYE